MPVSRMAWPSKWLRVRYGNGHRVQHDELLLVPQLLERRQPGRQAEDVVQRDEVRFVERERASSD